ncbi:hypothetical protein Tco_1415605 [Tanacetum coccineum]
MKIQAGIQVSRPGELIRQLQLWKRFGRLYLIVFVLVRNINVESAKKLWDSLESKYMAEDASSKKFLVSNFNNYKMVDSRHVMEQFNKLLRILGQYTQHGLKMDEFVSVSTFYMHVDAIALWIDSGATTHVFNAHCWFKTYEPVEDGSVLYTGDDHFAPVHGKGSVVLEFIFGKSINLFNVLYVSKLRKILISGHVLNKRGYTCV